MNTLTTIFLFTLISFAHADENEIRQSLQSKFPGIGKIEHIAKTPYSGLYEIVIDDQLLYTDEHGDYLFEGSVIETRSRRERGSAADDDATNGGRDLQLQRAGLPGV
jgi:thiol:disulfide interchange protein DsbC